MPASACTATNLGLLNTIVCNQPRLDDRHTQALVRYGMGISERHPLAPFTAVAIEGEAAATKAVYEATAAAVKQPYSIHALIVPVGDLLADQELRATATPEVAACLDAIAITPEARLAMVWRDLDAISPSDQAGHAKVCRALTSRGLAPEPAQDRPKLYPNQGNLLVVDYYVSYSDVHGNFRWRTLDDVPGEGVAGVREVIAKRLEGISPDQRAAAQRDAIATVAEYQAAQQATPPDLSVATRAPIFAFHHAQVKIEEKPDYRGRCLVMAADEWTKITPEAINHQINLWRNAVELGEYTPEQHQQIDRVRRHVPDLDVARDRTIAEQILEDWNTIRRASTGVTWTDTERMSYVRVISSNGTHQQGLLTEDLLSKRVRRTGHWTSFDGQGRLRETSTWRGGLRVGEARRYDPESGRLIERLEYDQGALHGTVHRFDRETGRMSEARVYQHGAMTDIAWYQAPTEYAHVRVVAPPQPTPESQAVLDHMKQLRRQIEQQRRAGWKSKGGKADAGPAESPKQASAAAPAPADPAVPVAGKIPSPAPSPAAVDPETRMREQLRQRLSRVMVEVDPDAAVPLPSHPRWKSVLFKNSLSFKQSDQGAMLLVDGRSGTAMPIAKVFADDPAKAAEIERVLKPFVAVPSQRRRDHPPHSIQR